MNLRLDRIDRALIQALAKNARASNKELAAEVGVAASTCHQRVRRLLESGVLRGFHAQVDLDQLSAGVEAMIAIRLASHSLPEFAALKSFLEAMPETLAVYHMAGADDFLVHVRASSPAKLRALVVESIAVRAEVGHIETNLIFASTMNPVLQFIRGGTVQPKSAVDDNETR